MEKLKLSNGMSVVYVGHAKEYSVCLSVNVGHVNEPRLGLANLFERVLLFQVKGIIPVFGGTMTAYTSTGYDLIETLEKVSKVFSQTSINEQLVDRAKADIIQQTHDTAPLTTRRMKLLYKHTAFGADLVRTSEEYIQSVSSFTVDEVECFSQKYYTAANSVLIISGPTKPSLEDKESLEKLFGSIPKGEKLDKLSCNIYTGGFGRMDVSDKMIRVMFGWDMSKFTISDSPAINVLMSMFWRRLERAYADAGIDDAWVELKIAGYYGLRTMRATFSSRQASAKELMDIFINAVNRICDTEASVSRMEKSRNAAMVEKLDKYEKSDNKALEGAWQLIGRGSMYNISNRINAISEISEQDIMDIACRVFRTSCPTYIVAASPEEDVYTLDEVLTRISSKALK